MMPQFNRLGSELAAEPPGWAKALGPVPSDPDEQEQWRRLAAEISVYRDTYLIPVTEPTPIPAAHREKDLGAELDSRITAMHKYTQQTSREPLSADDAHLMREAAEDEARMVEEQAPAEQVIDHLRTERAQESTLTPEQARTEQVAELARRLKASRPDDAQAPRTEAVDEALARIRAKRQQEAGPQESTTTPGEGTGHDKTRKAMADLKARQAASGMPEDCKPANTAGQSPAEKLRAAERLEEERRHREIDPPAPGKDHGPRYGR